ncbi:MAG: hypothetical protein EXR72_25735 [Myxococcales bacterium]|nr:hypothetical protein [Myxococcales bacterium]
MPLRPRVLCAGLVLVAVAGCRIQDTRTAVEHEQEAEHHRMEVEAARAMVTVAETTRPMQSATEAVGDPGTNLPHYAGARGATELQAAEEHEKAARRIRQDAEVACVRVPPSERTSCPVGGPVGSIEQIPRGVAIRPKVAPEPERLRALVDCAVAEARVVRPTDAESCPLLVPGATPRVVDRPGGARLEIIAPDDARGDEVRRRAATLP